MSKFRAINFTDTHRHTNRSTHTRPCVVRVCGRPPKWRQHLRQSSRGNHRLCHSQRQRQRRQVKCLSYKFAPPPPQPSSACLFFTWPVKNISGSSSRSPKMGLRSVQFPLCCLCSIDYGMLAVQSKENVGNQQERKAAESKHDRKNNGKHNEAYTDCVMINCTSL